jgi:hypothetical protein
MSRDTFTKVDLDFPTFQTSSASHPFSSQLNCLPILDSAISNPNPPLQLPKYSLRHAQSDFPNLHPPTRRVCPPGQAEAERRVQRGGRGRWGREEPPVQHGEVRAAYLDESVGCAGVSSAGPLWLEPPSVSFARDEMLIIVGLLTRCVACPITRSSFSTHAPLCFTPPRQ